MDTILKEIVENNRKELEARKREVSFELIQKRAWQQSQPLDLAATLRSDSIRLIAEVKKASPSRGVICSDFNPVEIARTYAKNHAAAISVLTENKYFRGTGVRRRLSTADRGDSRI